MKEEEEVKTFSKIELWFMETWLFEKCSIRLCNVNILVCGLLGVHQMPVGVPLVGPFCPTVAAFFL